MADELDRQLSNLRKVDAENRRAVQRTGVRRYVRPVREPAAPPPPPLPPPPKDDGKANIPNLPGGSPRYTWVPKRNNRTQEAGWDVWIAKMDNLMMWLPEQAYGAQIRAAEAVANMIRARLRSGEFDDISLSPLTIALSGGQIRKPLVTLANHVKVFRPYNARRGHRPATPGSKGSPGVFTSEYQPAFVGFDAEWDIRAFHLDQGFVLKMPGSAANKLMSVAKGRTGWGMIGDTSTHTEDPLNPGMKIWIIPGRLFSHIFDGPEAEELIRRTVEAAFGRDDGKDIAELRQHWEDVLKQEGLDTDDYRGSVSWDDVEGTLAGDDSSHQYMNPEELAMLGQEDRYSEDWED